MVGMGFNPRRNTQQYIHCHFLAGSDALQEVHFYQVVDHKAANSRFNRHFNLIRCLVVAMEVNALSREAGLQGSIQLSVRNYIK
ncbi:hypothetical protein D3C87_1932110 [compost metagenome]